MEARIEAVGTLSFLKRRLLLGLASDAERIYEYVKRVLRPRGLASYKTAPKVG